MSQSRRSHPYQLTLQIQIYETNTEPHTYAVNLHFAGTSKISSNNVVAVIGSSFLAAYRIFKKVFKEKTRVEWDDRISFAVERARCEKAKRNGGVQAADDGSVRGVPVSESGSQFEASLKAAMDEDFSRQPFAYHPPLYGPRGVLPAKEKQVFPEIGPPVQEQSGHKGVDEIDFWMSGAEIQDLVPTTHTAGGDGDFISGGEINNPDFDQFMMSGAMEASSAADAMAAGASPDAGYLVGQEENLFTDLETGYPFLEASGDHEGFKFDFDVPLPTDQKHNQAKDAAESGQQMVNGSNVGTASFPAAEPEDPISYQNTVPEPLMTVTEAQDSAAATQSFGETQAAIQARGQLEEFMGGSTPVPGASVDQPGDVHLGDSVLGKRNKSHEPEEVVQEEHVPTKKLKHYSEAEDEGFGGESHDRQADGSEDVVPEDAVPESGEEGAGHGVGDSDAANEQLEREMHGADS